MSKYGELSVIKAESQMILTQKTYCRTGTFSNVIAVKNVLYQLLYCIIKVISKQSDEVLI